MRLTKTNPIPEEKIDGIFFPYYEKDNLLKALEDETLYISDDVRKNIRKSIFDDYGYDIYSLFTNPDDENFVNLDEIYRERIKDFSSFRIDSFNGTVEGDLERISSLVQFRDSELYQEIAKQSFDNLERCKILMEMIGGGGGKNQQNNQGNPLNFGYQGVADQLPNQGGRPYQSGSRGDKQHSMNDRMNLMSEFANTVKDKKRAKDLKDSIDNSRSISGSEKKNLKDIIDAMAKDFIPQGGRDAGRVFEQLTEVLEGLDWSHFFTMNIGNRSSIVNTFTATKEFESSPLPINGFRMKKIKKSEQITRASIFEMAMDDDVFYGKYLNNDLIIKDYVRQRKLSQAFYVLLDVSGSMEGLRSLFARSVLKELLRRVVQGGAKYFIRPFESSPYDMMSAVNEQEAMKVDNFLSQVNFNGGGTDIKSAIEAAVRDIKKDKTKFEDIDILVITDGEDTFDLNKEELKGINLHTFLLNEGWEKSKGKNEVDKVKKMTKEQLKSYPSGIKSLITNSNSFEFVNPVDEIRECNPMLKLAMDMNITSREISNYY